MQSYQRRIVDDELDELVPALPAISLEGPRGVGKTSTAQQRCRTSYLLDEPRLLPLVQGDPERIVSGEPPILIDEWQLVPSTWDVIRRAVDADYSGGRFLLTGSSGPAQRPAHSGAGRIVAVRMRPLALPERLGLAPSVSLRSLLDGEGSAPIGGTSPLGLDDYLSEIAASGFPDIRRVSGRAREAALSSYIDHALDRDLPQQGYVARRRSSLLGWLRAYGAASATTMSYDRIRDAATPGQDDKPAKETTMVYRDELTRLWLLDPLPAWWPTRSAVTRLVQPEKHHLADPALVMSLLGLSPALLSRDATQAGPLFESLVVQTVRVLAQAAQARVSHLRTKGGAHEVDLILEGKGRRTVAFEIKLGGVPSDHDVRHLLWLREQMGDELVDCAVLTTGTYAYRRPDGIAVIPAALLGP